MGRKTPPLGQSLESLSPVQRAERYRQFASEAMRKGQGAADADRRSEYFAMAGSWHAMAVEAERALDAAERDEAAAAHRAKPAPDEAH